jgi:hypothetical protein
VLVTSREVAMSLEQKILERTAAATGDESIFVAADFLPNDLTVTQFVGSGDADTGSGAAADDTTWGSARGNTDRLPLVVMAVSSTNLYLLVTEPGQGILTADRYDLVETIEREGLRVRSADRDGFHHLIIEDATAIREFTMEGGHAGSHFMNDVLEALDAGS